MSISLTIGWTHAIIKPEFDDKKGRITNEEALVPVPPPLCNGDEKLCVAFSETEGRVRACPYATEEEAKEKCAEYAFNNRSEGENEGIE